jgi:hypothetical protein
MSYLRHLYLAYLSQPKADRPLYRLIRRLRIHRIVEMGVGSGLRSQRLIRAAQGADPAAVVRYTGIDLFESRAESALPGLSLKEAYRMLKATGAQTQLVPGDPFSALARVANGLTGTQLVVISAGLDQTSLARAWFYMPRLLTRESLVFCEEVESATNTTQLRQLPLAEIERLAGAGERRRAA